MYYEHFGLEQAPFSLTPNTVFLYRTRGYSEAINTLLVALRSGEGFVKVIGEVGTGKTLLCRELLTLLDDEFVTAFLPDPCLPPLAVRQALASELGIEVGEASDPGLMMKQITERLMTLRARGRRAVLLIDEAQSMPRTSLETVRLLSNLETETEKLLQVVLFGQPELEAALCSVGLRQLHQRITFACRLQPLDRAEVRGYVRHRMRRAGCEVEDVFTSGALRAVARASGGVPRLINIVCHKALMVAFGRGQLDVGRRDVREAAAETSGRARPGALARWLLGVGVTLGALAAALALYWAWGARP